MNLKEAIRKSNSQALQDVFALYINNFNSIGYFVDLGSNEPFAGNNSALLELHGWEGIMVDYVDYLVLKCSTERKNKSIQANLVSKNLTELLDENNCPEIIDYLSMDLDYGAAIKSIKTFDFNKRKIKCMTFEHDAYADGPEMAEESRNFLTNMGLKIICKDVTVLDGKAFEDWYINPDLVNKEIYEKIICENIEFNKIFSKLV
jgi:hypothetical protein